MQIGRTYPHGFALPAFVLLLANGQTLCHTSHGRLMNDHIKFRTGVELPGYYRPSKRWDVVVVRNGRLCAAIEMKSQVGPSFGNNFNNRTEEAVGSSVDFWLAFREGRLGLQSPWLGYFFFLEEADASLKNVAITSPAFPADPIFYETSYAKRYEILCRRLFCKRCRRSTRPLPRANWMTLLKPRSSSTWRE